MIICNKILIKRIKYDELVKKIKILEDKLEISNNYVSNTQRQKIIRHSNSFIGQKVYNNPLNKISMGNSKNDNKTIINAPSNSNQINNKLVISRLNVNRNKLLLTSLFTTQIEK